MCVVRIVNYLQESLVTFWNGFRRATYSDFGLAEGWWHVQVFRDHDVSEIMSILDAPHGQPVDVVDGQVVGQLDLNVLTLVASQGL